MKRYGVAAAVGAATVAVVAAKLLAEQAQATQARELERGTEERTKYIERTSDLLTKAMEEVNLTRATTPSEYRQDVRPNVMRILGSLESSAPKAASLRAQHDRLVRSLEDLVKELDNAADRFERDDRTGYERTLMRLDWPWFTTLKSSLQWLQRAIDEPITADG